MESTELTITSGAIPSIAESTWTREQIDLIKSTVAKGATDNELQLFLYVAKRSGLDPMAKQIHAVKRWNRAENRETMAIQTGIDGYRLIAARTEQHMGTDDATFDSETEDHPNKASVTVYRRVQGEKVAFVASARWSEYVQTVKDGSPNSFWQRMPFGMLGKCAEALALRKAFPAELSGVYTHEEMGQADNDPRPHPVAPPRLQELPQPVTPPKPEQPQAKPSPLITAPQRARLFAICKEAGISTDDFRIYLQLKHSLEHTSDISKALYDQVCTAIENGTVASWLLSQGETETQAPAMEEAAHV